MQSHDDGAVVVGRQRPHPVARPLRRPAAESTPPLPASAMTATSVILPGLIDAHVHFPQHRMLAAPAHDLLEWLDRFAFPEEARYAAEDHAAAAAESFLDKLVSHGTTSALVFSTVHGQAADCLFRAARRRGLCLITGATMMDCNAPDAVTRDAETSARESADLIASWHGVERLRYALTVRFAVTSSEEQMRLAGDAAGGPSGLPAAHASLGERSGDRSGASGCSRGRRTTPMSTRASASWARVPCSPTASISRSANARCLHDAGSTVVHCPTSNAFLGSGLFDIEHLYALRGARSGSASPATSAAAPATPCSRRWPRRTRSRGSRAAASAPSTASTSPRSATRAAFASTARSARSMPGAGPMSSSSTRRRRRCSPPATSCPRTWRIRLFALMMLGDDRAVRAVYVKGEKVAGRDVQAAAEARLPVRSTR